MLLHDINQNIVLGPAETYYACKVWKYIKVNSRHKEISILFSTLKYVRYKK